MRLLILLSAMIAGLTGLIAGGPASARAAEPAAIAMSAAVAVEQVGAAQAAQRFAVTPIVAAVRVELGAADRRVAPQAHKVDERRNE